MGRVTARGRGLRSLTWSRVASMRDVARDPKESLVARWLSHPCGSFARHNPVRGAQLPWPGEMTLKTVALFVLLVAALSPVQSPVSGLDLGNFDPTVRPQDDLYRAVNGRMAGERRRFPPIG